MFKIDIQFTNFDFHIKVILHYEYEHQVFKVLDYFHNYFIPLIS